MANTPSWVDNGVRVRTRYAPTQTPAAQPEAKQPETKQTAVKWPNGSAVFLPTGKPRKSFDPEEAQPGFLGRVVREGKLYRVHRWSKNAYQDVGTADSFSEALIKLHAGKP